MTYPPTYPPVPVYGGAGQPPRDPLIGRDVGDWIGNAFRAMRRSLPGLLAISLLAMLPSVVLLGLAAVVAAQGSLVGAVACLAAAALVGVAMIYLSQSAAIWLVTRQAAGMPATVGPAYGFALRRFGAVLGRVLLLGLLGMVGLVACIVPGLYVIVVSAATMPALVLFERGGGLIRRAFRLVNLQFWPAVGRVVLAWLIVVGAGSVFQFLPQVVGFGRATVHGDTPNQTVDFHGVGTLTTRGTGTTVEHWHWAWHLSAGLLVLVAVIALIGQLVNMVMFPAFVLVTYAWLRGYENPQLTTAHLAAQLDGWQPPPPQQPVWT